MTKLYQKSEITFAILWIVAYVVLSSYADQLSLSICIVKSVTAVLQIVMSLILFFWIRSNNLSEKYGFCPLFLQGSFCITCRSSLSHRLLSGAGLGFNMASRIHSCM